MATRSLFLILNLVAQSLATISSLSSPTSTAPAPAHTPTRLPARSPPLHPRASTSKPSNVPSIGFFDPRDDGGSFLTAVNNTFPAGLGEPINVIITANSDSAVLVDQQDAGGLRNYFFALGFAGECLGQHSGSDQQADLGDGHGYLNETAVIRWDYGDPTLGTCTETIQGGNHFRYWVQNGPTHPSNAYFLALSYEKPLALEHDIINNGYNLARDWFVGNATSYSSSTEASSTGGLIPTSNLTNGTAFGGSTSFNGYTYQTEVVYVQGYLQNTSEGINHYLTVGDGQNAVDGLVALMTVSITARPQNAAASSGESTYGFAFSTLLACVSFPVLLSFFFYSS